MLISEYVNRELGENELSKTLSIANARRAG